MKRVIFFFIFFSVFNCYGQDPITSNFRVYSLMLVQINSVDKLSPNEYVMHFTPIETYATVYFKLQLLDSSQSYILDSLETEYHKKLKNNGFNKAYTSKLTLVKASSFENFKRGVFNSRRLPVRKIKSNQIYFLSVNHLESTDNKLTIDFIVKPKTVNISQLVIVE